MSIRDISYSMSQLGIEEFDSIVLEMGDLLMKFKEKWHELDNLFKSNAVDKYIGAAQELEKILVGIEIVVEETPQKEHLRSVLKDVVLPILQEERLSLELPQLYALKLRTIGVFLVLVATFDVEVGEALQGVLSSVMNLWREYEQSQKKQQPTVKKGKKGGRGGRGAPAKEAEDLDLFDELDDIERLYSKSPLTVAQMGVILFNKSNQFFLLLSELDKRLLSTVANELWQSVPSLITSESIQVQSGVSDLIAQLCMLSLTPDHIKVWEDLRREEEETFDDLPRDEADADTQSLASTVGYKDEEYYAGYPFYKPTTSINTITDIMMKLLDLSVKNQEDADLGLSSVVGLLCGFTYQHYPLTDATKLVGEGVVGFLYKKIEEIPSKFPTAKVLYFHTLAHVIAFSPVAAVEPIFPRLIAFIETVEESTRKWAFTQDKQDQQDQQGGGGGGRGKGRKGGKGRAAMTAKLAREKRKNYEILKKKLIHTLSIISYKGGVHLVEYAPKFFQVIADIYKSFRLVLDYMIGLSQVLLTPAVTNNHPQKTIAQNLVAFHLPRIYNEAVEKLKEVTLSPQVKKDCVALITKISTAQTSVNSGTPLFPNFLALTLQILLDLLDRDGYQIGTSVLVSLQLLLMNNKNAKPLHDCLTKIIQKVSRYLELEDNEKDMLIFLKLTSLDTLELLFKQAEFKPIVYDTAQKLVPSVINTLKRAAILSKEEAEQLASDAFDIHQSDDDDDDDEHHHHHHLHHNHNHNHKHKHNHSSDTGSDKKKSPSSSSLPPLTKADLTNFKFDFGGNQSNNSSATSPGGSEFKFDFGSPTPPTSESKFKFDFGSTPTSTTVSPFKFEFPTPQSPRPSSAAGGGEFKFQFGQSSNAPVMLSNPDGESTRPAFTFGVEGGGFKEKGEQSNMVIHAEEKHLSELPGRGRKPPRAGGKGKKALSSKTGSPVPIPEPFAYKGKKKGSASPAPKLEPTKGGQVMNNNSNKGSGRKVDEEDDLIDSDIDSDDLDMEKDLEYPHLCIAALDTTMAMMSLLRDAPLGIPKQLYDEAKSALAVLADITQLEKSELKKREHKLSELYKIIKY